MLEKLYFYFRHSVNDLSVNKQRTLFALLCIAAGVAAIVSLQTLGVMIEDTLTGSLQESLGGDATASVAFVGGDEGEHGDDPDEQIDSASQSEMDEGKQRGIIATGGEYDTNYVTASGLEQIQAWADDWAAQQDPPNQVEMTYIQATTTMITGVSLDDITQKTNKTLLIPYIIDAGVYPLYGGLRDKLADMLSEPGGIVLSQSLADDLDAGIGDEIRVSGAEGTFIVRGVVPNDSEGGFDDDFISALLGYYYLDQSSVSAFNDIEVGSTRLFFKLDNPDQVEDFQTAFEDEFPYLRTTTTVDLEEQNSEISDGIYQMVIIMGLVSLLIGGIGIINTMLVIVSRRTTEVAVLKTVGLEGEQITILFLVEAAIMGVLGSLLGIVFGWGLALVLKGVAENFFSQTLTFRITLLPPLIGFVVGIVVTIIFGFLPTLAAGQVRPNLVLRPSDMVVPKAGRLRSFVAVLIVLVALSLVAQSLVRDLLDSDTLRNIARFIGLGIGIAMSVPLLIISVMKRRIRRTPQQRVIRYAYWVFLVVGLPFLGFTFGRLVPALLILFGTFISMGILYLMLWSLILVVAGGSIKDLWVAKLPKSTGTFTTAAIAIAFFPIWVLNAIWIAVMFFPWLIWRVIQWFTEKIGFVDFKLALRAMLANKGRGASTLLALVVGVFTLSLITMLTTALINRFEEMMIESTGGNVIIYPAVGDDATVGGIEQNLESIEGVHSYATVRTYSAEFVSLYDVSEDRTYTVNQLRTRAEANSESGDGGALDYMFQEIDGRSVSGNLPKVNLENGRQLNTSDTGPWNADAGAYPPIVIPYDNNVESLDIEVGDRIVMNVGEGEGQSSTRITFVVVGMDDIRGGTVRIGNSLVYAPLTAFDGMEAQRVQIIADVDESQIRAVRKAMAEHPYVFVLETRLLNDLIRRIIENFTSFPILVAGLALFTGGVVIANSVALTTLERRREIGIMKAVGLQRERVLGMLLLEYGTMGLIGGLIGVGIGFIILIQMLAGMFQGELGNSIPYGTAFQLMGLCIVIALVAAIATAWHASGEKPLNVLRYE
jgi:ABC-type antimicrobial peptide transport system permease subunit